jgi:large subunit ribosomal protein L33
VFVDPEKFCYFCGPIGKTTQRTHTAMAKKGNRVQVILECTEQKTSGVPGSSRYVTTKNRKNTPARIERKKYNPFLKKVTLHKEIK